MIEINTQSSIKIDKIYFDPYKIEKETHDAEIIFITHSHYDHFDMESIKKIVNNETMIVIPDDEKIKSTISEFNYTIVKPNQEYEIKNIKIDRFLLYHRRSLSLFCFFCVFLFFIIFINSCSVFNFWDDVFNVIIVYFFKVSVSIDSE